MVTAVVLAAGAGRRMGGRPKALLRREGVTFLERVVAACRDGGCARILVVIRPGDPDLAEPVRAVGGVPLTNADPERGMFSSVLLGLESALDTDPPPEAVLVFPVDHPDVGSSIVGTLVSTLRDHPRAGWAQPGHEGRGGHPILLRRETARLLLGRDPRGTLRDALDEIPGARIPVADAAVTRNVNYPKDMG